ncbi:fasciclin domain-containing protein [Hymenobacter sp. HDW8]|uniref:fasciclin domain-containing protein n=1 Tax=Hymenobacter sp. HDW8 TaxID=2714932 RepID=UPI001409DD28|nr:fasciclin domain-containing protein [Hymenobacter sp. HDW8]QIL74474.1 fasciclin domain-containing protein [Hymenobacter sp. HDW8]
MKKTLRNTSFTLLTATAFAFGVTSCGDNKTVETTTTTETTDAAMTDTTAMDPAMAMNDSSRMDTSGKNLAENAMAVSQISTLTTALKAAGLDDEAASAGPFTVFAPTNAAFEALPKGALDGLLKPESKEKLAGLLTYHVVKGRLMAADLKDGQQLTTVQGEKLTVSTAGGKVTVNGANVVQADVLSNNGVAHVIDQVLMPAAK